jgi:hypothetical protein
MSEIHYKPSEAGDFFTLTQEKDRPTNLFDDVCPLHSKLRSFQKEEGKIGVIGNFPW